ncbi:MAG: FmdB family zinc ribbon protein [Solirubrobacteraceae bacterium]
MPIYEYRCENGHLFEVMQKIADPPVTSCEECGATVARVFHPVAVHFKGSGFYNTDYGTAKRKRENERSASEGADKHDAKQKDKKKDSKPEAPSPSSSSSSPSSSSSSAD